MSESHRTSNLPGTVALPRPMSGYRARATAHQPRTADEIRAAVVELSARGYGDYEIAQATEQSVEAVRRILEIA